MRFRLWFESQQVYYYASRVPLQPGSAVRGWNTSKGDAAIQRVEQIFEQVRQEQFPALPSRQGCVFVSDNPKWKSEDRPHLYQVSVEGQTFAADSGWFGESVQRLRSEKDEEAATDWAKLYWSGKGVLGKMLKPEIIVQGRVTVIK